MDQITASLINETQINSTQQTIYSQFKHYTTNELLFTCFVATCSALIGGVLFFPSFRLARLHFLAIKYSQESKWRTFLFYVNFLLPLFVSLCWFRPQFGSKHRLSMLNKTEQALVFILFDFYRNRSIKVKLIKKFKDYKEYKNQ